MALTLAQLLAAPSGPTIKAQLLAILQAPPSGVPFPVSDWYSGGVARTLVEMETTALLDFVANLVPQIAGGGLLDYATGATTGWLGLLAQELYNLTPNAATYQIGNVTLTCAASAGPYTIAVNQLWFLSNQGLRYNNITGGALPSGGSLTVQVTSEFANNLAGGFNYAADQGLSINQLQTPLPGVTVSNPSPDFGAITHVGTGTGTIALSRTSGGTPPTSGNISVLITASGNTGAATFSYAVNGGAYIGAGTMASTFAVPSMNTTLTFTNGASGFLIGDTYNFSAPGSWVTQQGTDAEYDPNLIARCKARWSSLSAIPTYDCYSLWARSASSQVTRTVVLPDLTTAGQVDVTIAGQAGTLPSTVVAAVQNYINYRMPITARCVVSSAVAQPITIAATVTVSAANLAAAQVAAQQYVGNYIASVPIAGTVYLSQIITQLDLPAGVITVAGTTINGAALDYQLTALQVATFVQNLASTLTWVSV